MNKKHLNFRISFFQKIVFFQAILLLFFVPFSKAQKDSTVQIYKINIQEEIAPPIWHKVKKGINEAQKRNSDYIFIQMNTYGGLVDMADSIRTKILHTPIPVVIFIENNAASAGALIALACDSIFMKSGSTIGAATVVNETGEAVPDKYQSYMRKKMRTTAEKNGRNPDIAEAMVDPDKEVEGVSEKGKVVTFTTKEALKHGFCDAELNSIQDILEHMKIEKYEIKELKLTAVDGIIGFLINPMVSSILILMIFGGIYFELQTPGVGFPIAAAILGMILYFAPHYLQGLADNWEILLFFIGLVLLAVEVFVIPGFGIAGFAGISLIVTSLAFSMLQNNVFDFSLTGTDLIIGAFARVLIPFFLTMVLFLFFGNRITDSKAFRRLVLEDAQTKEQGFVVADLKNDLIGKTGTAKTLMKPSGKVEIDGFQHDATSEYGLIDAGDSVKVVKQERFHLIVRKA